jgi:hypothetical protein
MNLQYFQEKEAEERCEKKGRKGRGKRKRKGRTKGEGDERV